MKTICKYFNVMLDKLNIHLDENQKWTASWVFIFGLIGTYISPSITKEIISNLPAEWIAFESLFASVSALLVGIVWKGKVRQRAINSFIGLIMFESIAAFLTALYLNFVCYNVWVFAIATLLYSSLITTFVGKCLMVFRTKLWTEGEREVYDNNHDIICGITCVLGFGLALLFMPSFETALLIWGASCLFDNIGWGVVYLKNKKKLIENEEKAEKPLVEETV